MMTETKVHTYRKCQGKDIVKNGTNGVEVHNITVKLVGLMVSWNLE